MNIGSFSVSLSVKNIEASINFYTVLGFKIIDGGHVNKFFPDTNDTKWRIIRNNEIVLGIFEGMFENNIMTFNTRNIFEIQDTLKLNNIKLEQEADPSSTMSTSVILKDPDGNSIMFEMEA